MRSFALRAAAMIVGLVPVAGTLAQAPPAADTPMFPFVLPWDDSSDSIVNLSELLPKPAGGSGPVQAHADGHLYTGAERIRFFGVDLAFSANFPTHDEADKIAARLAKFGINIVRFHIMDMRRFPDGILARDAKNTTDLDPEALDRFDYFSAQLASRGIYTNLCLLNYRPINAADGLPPEIEQAGNDPFQRRHVVGFFDDRVVETQKLYARNLLTHLNPYSGKTYVENPAVAFAEINNENGLIHAWLGGQIDQLPATFRQVLSQRWNDWLRGRYQADDKLRAAWAANAAPATGQLLPHGRFAQGMGEWALNVNASASATSSISDDLPAGAPAGRSIRIDIARPGTQDWHIRLQHPRIAAEEDRAYAVSFWAKSQRPGTMRLSIDQTHEPWRVLGGRAEVELTTQWQHHRVLLTIRESDPKARLVFDPPAAEGSVWLADLSLETEPVSGLGEAERLQDGTVPPLLRADAGRRTAAAQRDWMQFMWETEDRYWQTMYRYLKDELKVQAPVIGTVVGCSTPTMMAKLDAIDAHAYWQHPAFPGRPWDRANWIVRNETMVNDRGGVLAALAMRRVQGKPFCVTEYGNAAPNTYVSEGHLLRAAYACLQDWDYTSASRYSHGGDWDLKRIRNFFDIDQHPTKMATLVPAAAMYLRGDIKPAESLVVATLDKSLEIDRLRRSNAWELVDAHTAGVPREAALVHRVAIVADGQAAPAGALGPNQLTIPADRFISDTRQLDWDLRQPGRGVVTIDALRSKAVIGFGGGKRFDLGGIIIEPGASMQDGWSAITVTAMRGEFAAPPCRVLITATGNVANTRMKWTNERKESVGENWGEAPSVVEGIPARITLPFPAGSTKVWPLDERGQRGTPFDVTPTAGGQATITIGPDRRTIWYEVESR